MVVATVQPLADARGSYEAARAAAVKGCEKTRGSLPQFSPGFFQLRAATVRERVVVATVQPLADARGSYDVTNRWMVVGYSYRKQTMGSRFAARLAG